MAAAGVTFKSSDGTTNLTREVQAAFWDAGITVPEYEAAEGLAEEARAPAPVAVPPMSPADVTAMLGEREDWKLAVGWDDKHEILTKEDLRSAWDGATSTNPVEVRLRPMAPSERLLVEAAPKLYAPDVSYDRLKEALALPVAQAGLVATAAGLFGLLALRDKIGNTDAMKAAIILAALAVGVSLVGRYFLREATVKLLDSTCSRSAIASQFEGPCGAREPASSSFSSPSWRRSSPPGPTKRPRKRARQSLRLLLTRQPKPSPRRSKSAGRTSKRPLRRYGPPSANATRSYRRGCRRKATATTSRMSSRSN